MRNLFDGHKRLLAVGLAAALILALALVAGLLSSSGSASAQTPTPTPTPTPVPPLVVTLAHVNPDGSDYLGNPLCPQTVWSADGKAKVVQVDARHDCNNITSQRHVIRTVGFVMAGTTGASANQIGTGFNLEGVGTVVADGPCGMLGEVTSRPLWGNIDDDEDTLVDEDPVDTIDNDLDTVVDEDPPGDPRDGEYCVVIHSKDPGETSVTFTYFDGYALVTTPAVFKEWDKMTDTVILKAADVESVALPSPPWPSGTKVTLPKDADGDGNRDAADEHLMDHNGEVQEHAVMFDEAVKRLRSAEGPISLIEVVHGQHVDFPDHGTEGAVILAFIYSPRGCTYFTSATGDVNGDGWRDWEDNYGTAVVGRSDWRGFMVGPQVWPIGAQFSAEALEEAAAHGLTPGMAYNGTAPFAVSMLGVAVDSWCEEQALIAFKVGYPDFVQSVPEIPAPELVTINWTTVEMAKQPQIRWAGEEIVLEKRWASPGDWWPEPGAGIDNDGDGKINEDPPDDDGDGLVDEDPKDGLDTDADGNEDGTFAGPGFGNCNDGLDNDADTKIDAADTNCTAFIDEDTGGTEDDDDKDGLIDEDGPDLCPFAGWLVKYSKLGGPGGLISGLPLDWDAPFASEPDVVWSLVTSDCVSRALYSSEQPGWVDVEATLHSFEYAPPLNKHAFLVWYLKIYQVKLENIPLKDGVGRELHNAGTWSGEDALTAAGVTEEELNVSQDALARVTVKGYFYGGNTSGRGDVCIDMDGDGDGIDDDADTLFNEDPADGEDNDNDTEVDEDTQVPGQPYKTTTHEGCKDSDDHALAGGYWVLPDDMAALAGPDPDRLATWDVMSEPDVAAGDLIGPKSTLDSHDAVLRRVVPCVVLKVRPDGSVVPDFSCKRKTVDPDDKITAADALMPPLKILAQIVDDADGTLDVGESGFLWAADKDGDVGIKSAYVRSLFPDSPYIPTPVNNGGYDWDSWGFYYSFSGVVQGPYNFYDILTKHEEDGYVRNFRFYTDNRGLGYFFVNGDFKLTFDDCPRQALSGTPDCSPGDVVGSSVVSVIGDYPYFRAHPAVESNPVEKTWKWDGFKSVTGERIDPTHTRIIAHLRDRDGYCKWEVGADPTKKDAVRFSPSLNEVQHEWIEFLLNTEVGFIRDISPNALYMGFVADQHSVIDIGMPRREILKIHDHIHWPLAKERATGLEEGFIFEAERAALARAEDVRVLNFYGKGAAVDDDFTDPTAPDECQAWVLIEHPADQTPNVSVVFHDPEGQIDRHWPENERTVVLVPGWNDSCYTGPEVALEDALTDAGLIAEDGTSSVLAAYRFVNADQSWERWFPGDEPEDTLTTLQPYDQLFLLLDPQGEAKNWVMSIIVGADADNLDSQVKLVELWNSVCYAGADKAPAEATAGINGSLVILYTLASDQTWRRYVPNLEQLTNIITLNQHTSVVLLMKNEATWVFDP